MSSEHGGARHAVSVWLWDAVLRVSLSSHLDPPVPVRKSRVVWHVRLEREAYRCRHESSPILTKQWTSTSRSYGVTVSTLDSESSDRGSNPRRTFAWSMKLILIAKLAWEHEARGIALSAQGKELQRHTPTVGLEPTTTRLRALRSAD